MKLIKPSTCTQLPIGSKVKIIDKGQVCTTYKNMVTHMKLHELGGSYVGGINPLRDGDVATVIAKAMHEEDHYGEILAVRFGANGPVALILARGVVEFEPVAPAPTVEQLKVEVATLKAKLWDAEQKLKKMVAIATE